MGLGEPLPLPFPQPGMLLHLSSRNTMEHVEKKGVFRFFLGYLIIRYYRREVHIKGNYNLFFRLKEIPVSVNLNSTNYKVA